MVKAMKAARSKSVMKRKQMMKSKSAASIPKWTKAEKAFFQKLKTPQDIQRWLDKVPYDPIDGVRSVRKTIRTKKAHCFGGALLAAYALHKAGFGPPRIMLMWAENDDSHIVAVYKVGKYWGCLAKSNWTLTRSRDPVYRSLRELMMSYFDLYFNTKGEKSFTGYSRPINPYGFKVGDKWLFSEEDVEELDEDDIYEPRIPVRPPGMRKKYFMTASRALIRGGTYGANPKGLCKPK